MIDLVREFWGGGRGGMLGDGENQRPLRRGEDRGDGVGLLHYSTGLLSSQKQNPKMLFGRSDVGEGVLLRGRSFRTPGGVGGVGGQKNEVENATRDGGGYWRRIRGRHRKRRGSRSTRRQAKLGEGKLRCSWRENKIPAKKCKKKGPGR
ncbi:uncharacterized protein [Elaeis guineensis]|uniref:uncharacterized protein n=1 Tax=Elaeis guineensis var. tenera TaxID=51953 RepID=UPI003C6D8D2E